MYLNFYRKISQKLYAILNSYHLMNETEFKSFYLYNYLMNTIAKFI